MTGQANRNDYSRRPRRDRMDAERVSGPCRARGEWKEPSTCPECGAILHHGRWQWGTAEPGAGRHLCPACQQIRDWMPAGPPMLSGPFFAEHREEILHRVRNTEAKARAEHPLERIVEVRDEADQTVVALTDSHLTHGIGEALRHADHGEVDSHYTDEGDLLRVSVSHCGGSGVVCGT